MDFLLIAKTKVTHLLWNVVVYSFTVFILTFSIIVKAA